MKPPRVDSGSLAPFLALASFALFAYAPSWPAACVFVMSAVLLFSERMRALDDEQRAQDLSDLRRDLSAVRLAVAKVDPLLTWHETAKGQLERLLNRPGGTGAR